MYKYLLCLLTVILISSFSFSQMKLNLPSDMNEEETSNLKLVLDKTETPADATSLIPGTFMIGLLGDITFPFGEVFKTYAGTGWSIHGFGEYSILNSLSIGAKVGYIKFGEVETDFNTFNKTSRISEGIKQTNSQVILAFLIKYLLGGDPTCLGGFLSGGIIQPFIALQLCLILKAYTAIYPGLLEINKIQNTSQSNEFEDNSTIFGISPSVGTYIKVSKDIRLIFSADYYYLFDKADETIDDSGNINYLSLSFGAAYSFNWELLFINLI